MSNTRAHIICLTDLLNQVNVDCIRPCGAETSCRRPRKCSKNRSSRLRKACNRDVFRNVIVKRFRARARRLMHSGLKVGQLIGPIRKIDVDELLWQILKVL